MKLYNLICSNRFGFYAIMLIAILVLFAGCVDYVDVAQEDEGGSFFEMGGVTPVIHLPIPAGKSFRCVQGVSGSFSHTGVSTKYDIDFDTPNNSDEDVFAPVSGYAYVHTKNSSKNFGKHVNVSVGNGQYVVIAHLSKILLSSNQTVEEGELIGVEGCTGYCTGDHIHIGLHEGDPAKTAEHGKSVPSKFVVSDKTTGGITKIVSGSELVCGISQGGGEKNGHVYTSDLIVNRWHPNGTLVKTSQNNKVYLLAQDLIHWIENEQIFYSHKYSFKDVVHVSQEEFDCYSLGNNISSIGYVNAFVDSSDQIWLVVGMSNDPHRYRIQVLQESWREVLLSWGLVYASYDMPASVDYGAGSYLSWPVKSGKARFRSGTLIKEQSKSDVYVVSENTAIPIVSGETFRLLGYSDKNIQVVQDGKVSDVMKTVGSCSKNDLCLKTSKTLKCKPFVDDEELSEKPIKISVYEKEEPKSKSSVTCSGEQVCIESKNNGDVPNILFFAANSWINSSAKGKAAYIYGQGGCYGWSVENSTLAYLASGYHFIDFSKIDKPCTGFITLISTVGTDGSLFKSDGSNWQWWQNAEFCSKGSGLCQLMDNNSSWEEWLIAVSWNPKTGLKAVGNGFTSNTQLP
jgi:hypothetical protein